MPAVKIADLMLLYLPLKYMNSADVILKDAAGTGVDVLASRDLAAD